MSDPFAELQQHELDPSAATLLPLETCLARNIAVLGRVPEDAGVPLTVGALNASDGALAAELSAKLRRQVRLVQLNHFEIRRALSRIYRLPLDEDRRTILKIASTQTIEFAPDQSPVKLLNDLLAVALKRRASDVHIEAYLNDVDLRFRIDGVLQQITTPLSPDNLGRVVSRIKVLCELDHAERRRSQDGRFSVLYDDDGRLHRVDIRVTILPGAYGQDVSMRILDSDRFNPNLEKLGVSVEILRRYQGLARYPQGLLFTTGPTGSGKTTTLYATLPALRGENRKILTVEDPIEYEIPKVNQKSVTGQMGFSEHLRSFLRANPDVIMVGEVRDAETAEIAVRAATTGHLVISSLHTNDAVAAIGRLRVLGVPDDLLSEVLIGVLAQRLLRRVCEKCRREVQVRPVLAALYYREPPKVNFFEGAGCDACGGTGYRGLVGAFELFQPNGALVEAIARGTGVEELRRLAREHGWVPLVEDALVKVEGGVTSLQEVARRIPPKYPVRG